MAIPLLKGKSPDTDLPGIRSYQSGKDLDGGALACTVGTDKSMDRPFVHMQTGIIKRLDLTIVFIKSIHSYH